MTPSPLRPPDRHDQLVRPDDRVVGWAEWGAPDARPVLFVTGAAMTSTMGFGADDLASLGLRLVCIDRAGLGRSSPDPDKSFASWSADVAAVLDHLGVRSLPIIGFSQGAPFALALAHAGLATSLALVSPQDELSHPAMRPQLAPEVQALVDAVAHDPAAFEADFAQRVDADGFHALVLAMSGPADRAVYAEPAFAAAYLDTLRDGFAAGPAGYVRDLTLALSPWPTGPESVSIPVHLWHGLLDTSPVHSPDHGLSLAARFPRATRHALPDEGGSLLWTRARDILTHLT